MKKVLLTVALLLLSFVKLFAFGWPMLTEDIWHDMTIEKLETYLESNDLYATWSGSTALISALAGNSKPEIIQFLIKKGVDVRQKSANGWTPLMFAGARTENPEIIQLLIDKGADVNAKDEFGATALDWALALSSNQAVIQLLIDNGAED